MKYFKDQVSGLVHAYADDGSQDEFILDDLVEMTQAEIDAHLNQAPVIEVPESISTAQGHLALIEYGKYQAAVDYINAIPDATQKLIAEVNFYRRNDWQRDNETLLSLSTALGISNAELDQMFIYGSTR